MLHARIFIKHMDFDVKPTGQDTLQDMPDVPVLRCTSGSAIYLHVPMNSKHAPIPQVTQFQGRI